MTDPSSTSIRVGSTVYCPAQPPFGSRVRVNGGRYGGLEFELVTADSWLCRHRGVNVIETWSTLVGSARSAGVTLLHIGAGASEG